MTATTAKQNLVISKMDVQNVLMGTTDNTTQICRVTSVVLVQKHAPNAQTQITVQLVDLGIGDHHARMFVTYVTIIIAIDNMDALRVAKLAITYMFCHLYITVIDVLTIASPVQVQAVVASAIMVIMALLVSTIAEAVTVNCAIIRQADAPLFV